MADAQPASLLIVDDDAHIRELLADFLHHQGYHVLVAADGHEMFLQLAQHAIDLILLDIIMPGDDGFILCSRLRENSTIPVIMLTAMNDISECIKGFETGADDYLSKPFNPRELVARIKAVLRRSHRTLSPHTVLSGLQTEHYDFSGWHINRSTRKLLTPDGIEVVLSTGEYSLLSAFLDHPRRVLSRDQLLEITHNRNAGPFDRSIDIQVSRLRQKIEPNPKKPEIIKTIRGGGYMFTPLVSRKVIYA